MLKTISADERMVFCNGLAKVAAALPQIRATLNSSGILAINSRHEMLCSLADSSEELSEFLKFEAEREKELLGCINVPNADGEIRGDGYISEYLEELRQRKKGAPSAELWDEKISPVYSKYYMASNGLGPAKYVDKVSRYSQEVRERIDLEKNLFSFKRDSYSAEDGKDRVRLVGDLIREYFPKEKTYLPTGSIKEAHPVMTYSIVDSWFFALTLNWISNFRNARGLYIFEPLLYLIRGDSGQPEKVAKSSLERANSHQIRVPQALTVTIYSSCRSSHDLAYFVSVYGLLMKELLPHLTSLCIAAR